MAPEPGLVSDAAPGTPTGSRRSPRTASPRQRRRQAPTATVEHRTIARVDTLSVARTAFVLHLVLAAVVVVAGTFLWWIASSAGLVGDLESTVSDLWDYEQHRFVGSALVQTAALLSMAIVAAGTGAWTLGAIIFNLVADLVGGIRLELVTPPDRG